MNTVDRKHSSKLREALLALDHSGPNGFEGLLGMVLGCITGQSFRLAKSGSQRGRDGDSAFDGGATYYEGKRYQESPKSHEVTTKLFDLLRDASGQIDLWILGETCEIAAQTATDMRVMCDKIGIGSVLLDWSNNDLGPLLVATANAGKKAKDFINDKLTGKPKASLIKAAARLARRASLRAEMSCAWPTSRAGAVPSDRGGGAWLCTRRLQTGLPTLGVVTSFQSHIRRPFQCAS